MKMRLIVTLVGATILMTLASLWMGQQAYTWFPPQASAESELIDDLFSFLTALGTFIFLGVAGTLGYSVLFSRAGRYDYSDGPPIEGNITLEIVWTAIPFALVIWIAAYSYQVYEQMDVRGPMEMVHLHMPATMEAAYAEPMDDSLPDSLPDSPTAGLPSARIAVQAKQWAWIFHYPGENGQDITSTELHLPVDHRIKLELTSDDVLHGLYIPAFRLKQDIIPNKTIDFEFTPTRIGTYRLRDSQYSGTYFAAMQADVVVESPQAYQSWLADAANRAPSPAYNRAAFEYNRAAEQTIVRGWETIPPAPPPIVNFAPKQAPDSPPV
ncbi:MAG: cytochrome c oxidase subunit II [Pegethrix bostrychoides GSE-TBD4-15B]|jgi:cytochrome c oxidase subunit 2|uniref:Cytochrome c oxidase subunit 2 n=1 Tax=Pegethrix bostrychoides GSE-TBD4-15B TaxID=2839662 RepID=A0A951U3X0_9CYAN|nr:cytochrome c oxidase subunit II [Pegethrix bostrychoides GSE-TBD4-15B]